VGIAHLCWMRTGQRNSDSGSVRACGSTFAQRVRIRILAGSRANKAGNGVPWRFCAGFQRLITIKVKKPSFLEEENLIGQL
jgi:hypothetical protein